MDRGHCTAAAPRGTRLASVSPVVSEPLFLGMLFNEEGVSMVLMPWKVDLCTSDPFTSVFQQASAKANHPDMA